MAQSMLVHRYPNLDFIVNVSVTSQIAAAFKSTMGGRANPQATEPDSATDSGPTRNPEPLTVDEERTEVVDDGDSAFEDEISTYTASLTSSVVDYPIEHGRRYHAFRAGNYVLPNDEQETDRLDLMHVLMTKIGHDQLQYAPIDFDKPLQVLDIGTGTGIWAVEMADEHPNINILGNDLSPIQSQWLPPNVKFEVDDVESPWMHQEHFDYVFCRYMTACIKDWPKLVENIKNSLVPGGYAEFWDFDLQYYSDDGSLKEDSYIIKWITTLMKAADIMGRDHSPGVRLQKWVTDAGFKNVVHHVYKTPVGPWPKDKRLKDIGYCNIVQILQGLEAFSLRLFCNILSWKEEEVVVLLANVRKELKDPKIHSQIDFHIVYGQKEE